MIDRKWIENEAEARAKHLVDEKIIDEKRYKMFIGIFMAAILEGYNKGKKNA